MHKKEFYQAQVDARLSCQKNRVFSVLGIRDIPSLYQIAGHWDGCAGNAACCRVQGIESRRNAYDGSSGTLFADGTPR